VLLGQKCNNRRLGLAALGVFRMLKIDAINVSYGHAKVLHDVSLEIRQGEMGFIIGRNGAGKTTLLKSIIGLLTPWSGSILFQGQAVVGLSPERLSLAGIRYVGQEKKVFASLTVRENLEIAAYACQEPVEKAIDRITGFYPKMKKFLDTKAGLLSGGQRQILLVGRALVGTPKLLLIDEPTQGLAAIVIEDINDIMSDLKQQVSALIVEQNLAMVNRLADRVFVLKEGKIVSEIDDKSMMSDTRKLEDYV
jgi:ABC-type branched-subunit amino acid transport system ATPase component